MKRVFLILVGIVAIAIAGMFIFRQQFVRAQHEEIAELLPEEALGLFLEFPHFNDSMEELFEKNPFFSHFSRENLEKVLPEDTWRDLESILNDPYFSDQRKRRRMFNEQIVLAGYYQEDDEYGGLLGIRGAFEPAEYYALVTGMKFLQDEGFLIKEYEGENYFEGIISFDSDFHPLSKEEQTRLYLFNLKNCFFISNSENLVKTILDFQKDIRNPISENELFAKNKTYRLDRDIIGWGFSKDILGKVSEFRSFSYDDTLQSIKVSEMPVKAPAHNFETLADYYRPESLISKLDANSNYQLVEAYLERYLPMMGAAVDEFEFQPWLNFIQNNWDSGYLMDLDARFDVDIDFSLSLLFPLKENVDVRILDELAELIEPLELSYFWNENELVLGDGEIMSRINIYFDDKDQLLGMYFASKPEKTGYADLLREDLLEVREQYGLQGVPAGANHLNGEALNMLYEQVKVFFTFLVFMDPTIQPRIEFIGKLVNSIDHISGYSFYIEDPGPAMENITYFKSK